MLHHDTDLGAARAFEVLELVQPCLVLDPSLRVVLVNSGWERLHGVSRLDAVGRELAEVSPAAADPGQPFHQGLLRVMRDHAVVSIEDHAPAPGACARVTICPLSGGGVAVLYQEVCQRLRDAETAARTRADELAALLDAVPAVVWIARDAQARQISGNRASCELLRVPSSANLSTSAPEGERPSHFRVYRDGVELSAEELPVQIAATRGVEVREFEEEVVFDDGARHHLLGNAVPVLDESGRPRGAVAAFIDISERKRAEDALREADRRKDDFLAMLSHELRNPLAPIRTAAYILGRTEPGGEQARRACAVIERQVEHLTRLVDDLLDVTRISSGKMHLQVERLELGALVRATAEDHRPLFVRNAVELETEITAESLFVRADPTRVAQMLGNLLLNAGKFTPAGGRATVSLERGGGARAILRVKDTGIGIDPDVLERVFEPFVQSDRTLDRASGGLGLGLALVRGLATLHGGAARAASAGPGTGAEITLELPLDAGAGAEGSTSAEVPPAAGLRLLIIEDNPDAAEALREVLAFEGHVVETAPTAAEGIAKALAFAPDAVICDLGLPDRSGYDVARALRASEALRSVHLIALSGYAAPEDVAKARAAGFDRHLKKPAGLDAIEAALAEVRPVNRS